MMINMNTISATCLSLREHMWRPGNLPNGWHTGYESYTPNLLLLLYEFIKSINQYLLIKAVTKHVQVVTKYCLIGLKSRKYTELLKISPQVTI